MVFCVDENRIVLLHGFTKKIQKTPQNDLTLVSRRPVELARLNARRETSDEKEEYWQLV